MKKLSHTGCIDLVSPQCESAYDYQEEFLLRPIGFTNIIIIIISRSDRHQRRQTLTLTSCSFYVPWANGRPVVF